MNAVFALEYSLGHSTHAENLKGALKDRRGITPHYIDLVYHHTKRAWERLPLVRSNWSVRASIGAYLGVSAVIDSASAALFHTQVTSLFSPGLMRRLPSVVSLDATPLQYDSLGAHYGHRPSRSQRLETLKKHLNERAFQAARQLVAWSSWAKQSLVDDYGIPAEKITVIPPGIDVDGWSFFHPPKTSGEPVHLLFVGADFHRKGGDILLDAFQALPSGIPARLHVVTRTPGVGDGVPNTTVYRDLTANSERLRALYRQADLFVFPTRGDCLPLAVMEALAAGLPVITTGIAALPEAVRHQENGLLVPVDDVPSLTQAIRHLVEHEALRLRMSREARATALERFNARVNYPRLVDLVGAIGR